ncbi:hypothetical protein LINGRAHAP2_LOCUS9979 [Linum grandiflorum]
MRKRSGLSPASQGSRFKNACPSTIKLKSLLRCYPMLRTLL